MQMVVMSKKWVSTRFASPTQGFGLDVLVSHLRKGFVLSVALASAIHLVVVGINPFAEAEKKISRPLTTKFIKRQPRLSKPLELRKIPKFKRQMIRRQMRMAAARMDQVQATAVFSMRSIIARSIGATKINALDTGRYRAVVVQNPNDKQGLKGFIKLARVHSMGFVIDGSSEAAATGSLNIQEIDIICDMINEWTGLRADFAGSFTFDDERLLEIPIIMPQGTPTEGELQNMARYLLGGGFVLLEGLNRDQVRQGLRDIYGVWREALEKYGGLIEGRDFYIARLPDDHPLFSAYFDLGAGAPRGASGFGMFTSLSDFNVVQGFFVKGGGWWQCRGHWGMTG